MLRGFGRTLRLRKMSKKKLTIVDRMSFPIYSGISKEDLITLLNSYPDNSAIEYEVEADGYKYCGYYHYAVFEVVISREETDDEYEKRLAKNKKARQKAAEKRKREKEEKERHARKMYERLKEKYGNE